MPAKRFNHSVGLLLTELPTIGGGPDEHSFILRDHEISEGLGWGESGEVREPDRNPPNGETTTVRLHLDGGLTEADKTALAELLALHRERYKEARLFVSPGGHHYDQILDWCLAGAMPGAIEGAWGTESGEIDQ